MNKITHEEQLINLCVLLGGTSYTETVELPSNKDADKVLKSPAAPVVNTEDEEIKIQINENYVTLVNEGGVNNWYVPTCTEVNEDAGTYKMDHLHCE